MTEKERTRGFEKKSFCVNLGRLCELSVTLQRVGDGEEVDEGSVQWPPGQQSEAPAEAQQHQETHDAAQVRQHSPVGRLVLGVLPLDPGQLHHHHDEDQQAQCEDQAKVGHHRHIESHVVAQPAAKGRNKNSHFSFKDSLRHFALFPYFTLTIYLQWHLRFLHT